MNSKKKDMPTFRTDVVSALRASLVFVALCALLGGCSDRKSVV